MGKALQQLDKKPGIEAPKKAATTKTTVAPKSAGKFKLNPMLLIPALAAGAYLIYTKMAGASTKTTPTVTTWPTATSLTSGQALSSSTLTGGTTSVPGTFTWTNPSNTPSVGTSSQNVTFTPTATTTYSVVTGMVQVTVTGGTPNVVTGLQNAPTSPSPSTTPTPSGQPTTTTYNYTVTGIVNWATANNLQGSTFSGVSVSLSGNGVSQSTTTNSSGQFSFTLSSTLAEINLTVIFGSSGYVSGSVAFQVTAAAPNVNLGTQYIFQNSPTISTTTTSPTTQPVSASTTTAATPPNPNIITLYPANVTVTSSGGANVRTAPTTSGSIITTYSANQQFQVMGYVSGQSVTEDGVTSNLWWQLSLTQSGQSLFMWTGATVQQPSTSVIALSYTAPSGVTTSTSGAAAVSASAPTTGSNEGSTVSATTVLTITPTAPSTASSSSPAASNNGFPRTVTVNVSVLNVRSAPNSTAPLAGSQELYNGETFIANNYVVGQLVSGENRWWVSQYGNYVWVGGTSTKP